MSGFLSRLAERAVGAARLVEPRLRSRFEPDAQFTVASPMEIDEFLDVPPADLARPSAEHRAPTAPAGSRAPAVVSAAPASNGAPRQPVPATQQVHVSTPSPAAHEDVATETVSMQMEGGVEPVFPLRADAPEPVFPLRADAWEPGPARPPDDTGATKHPPQLAARAGADHASESGLSLAADPPARQTPIAANAAKSGAVRQGAPMDQTSIVERLVAEPEPDADDPVFAADTPISGSRFLDSALPPREGSPAPEHATQRATPAASSHVRAAKTSRHEVRRPATAAIDGDHDNSPTDGAAIDLELSTRRMDRAESMRLDHLADSEAVVQVRIGRIDVRAAAPPPPAIPRSTQPRVESLDDYLKRTSGRR